jgi:hypothetical protein
MPIAVRSLEVSAEKYLRNCIRAYFEGQPGCDLRYILGVIGEAKAQARMIVETRFSRHTGSQTYRDLIARL